MYCKHCGNQLPDEAKFCPYCGKENRDGYFDEPISGEIYSYNSAPQGDKPVAGDTGRFAWAVLGFFFPVVGLVLYFVLRHKKPLTCKKLLIGSIVGFAVEIVCSIIYTIAVIIGGIFGSAEIGSYLDIINRIVDIFIP